MADPLSVSASVAGLITIADIIVRNGYKYVKLFYNADKSVGSLVSAVNLLSGTLHSLRNIAERLESDNASMRFATQIHHVDACYQTLRKIMDLLDKFELSKTKGFLHATAQRLRWPLTSSETKELESQVDKHRATLSLALQADEMSALLELLAKQENIGALVSELKEGLDREKAQRKDICMSEERKKIFEWLCPASIDPATAQESNVSLRRSGTGVWFTEGQAFQEWRLKRNSKLWVHGIAGAGKTILVSTIIQEIERKMGNDEGIAFFYCDYKNSSTHSISHILGSLVKQFVIQDNTEAGYNEVKSLYMTHQNQNPKPELLLDLLHAAVQHFAVANVVIDGLDEISHNLSDAIEVLHRINQIDGNIKTLFASRREVEIENFLGDYEMISIAAQSSDLELYVAFEIENRTKRRQLNIKDPDLKQEIMKRLVNGADGMFRWVACQMDHLCELGTDRARRSALDKLPRGLPKTYERILTRVLETHEETQDLVIRALQWLTVAEQALSSKALIEALALNLGDSKIDSDAMTSEEELLKWCSSLIRRRVDNEGLELAHFTVKEYLLSINTDTGPQFTKFKIYPEESNLLLGSICLTYLNLDSFVDTPPPDHIFEHAYSDSEADTDIDDADQRRIQDVKQDQQPNGHESTGNTPYILFRPFLESYPLLSYAATTWYSHSRIHHTNPNIIKFTHRLFHVEKPNQFLWWSYAFLSCELKGDWTEAFSDTTTLHWAALLQLEEVCSWLVHKGSNVNRDSLLGRPLDCVILGTRSIWLWSVDELEDSSLDSLDESYCHNRDLMAKTARTSIVRLFIQAGAKLNERTNSNLAVIPLYLALLEHPHDKELISVLIEAGARVDMSAIKLMCNGIGICIYGDAKPKAPCGYRTAIENTQIETLPKDIQTSFASLSTKLRSLIPEDSQSLETVDDELSSSSHDIKILKDSFFQAIEYGQEKGTKKLFQLLEQQLDPTSAVVTFASGLRIALQNNHVNIVHLLLDSNVNPNTRDGNGNAALHHCFGACTVDPDLTICVMKALVAHGGDLYLRNSKNELPLHPAVNSASKKVIETIFDIMGDRAMEAVLDFSVPSILHYAMKSGHDEVIFFLLGKYKDDELTSHLTLPEIPFLEAAVERKNVVVFRHLLARLPTRDTDSEGSSSLYIAAKYRNSDALRLLLDTGHVDNSCRDDGYRAIHLLARDCEGTSPLMLQLLLSAGEDPTLLTNDGSSLLHLMMPPLSLPPGLVPQPHSLFMFGWPGIFNQMSISKLKLVTENSNPSRNCRDNNGRTPLMLCCSSFAYHQTYARDTNVKPMLECINLFVDQNAEIDITDNEGDTALHYLCRQKITTPLYCALKILLDNGSMLDHKNKLGITPFELIFLASLDELRNAPQGASTTTKSLEEVICLIVSEMPVHGLNDQFSDGLSPLGHAIKHGCRVALKILLSKEELDVDTTSQDNEQMSPLEMGSFFGCSETVARQLLCRSNRPVYAFSHLQGYTLLHFATYDLKNQTMLRLLLKEREIRAIEVDSLDRRGETALQTAVGANRPEAAKLLLEAGAKVDIISPRDGSSLIHIAAQVGSLAISKLLMQHNAAVNAIDKAGNTPLLIAASRGFHHLVDAFAQAGGNISHRNGDGMTALLISAERQHWSTVELIVELGGDIRDTTPNRKITTLHMVSSNGPWKLIRLLLQKGAYVEAINDQGDTPLLVAALCQRWDIVQQFVEHGVNLDAISCIGFSVMHYAIQAGQKNIVELLEKCGATLHQDARDQDGLLYGDSLSCAATSGNLALFKVLLREKQDLDFQSDHGVQMAHYAMLADNGDIRTLLLSDIAWNHRTAAFYLGRNSIRRLKAPNHRHIVNASPLHFAAACGRNEAIKFLKAHDLISDINIPTDHKCCYAPLHLATMRNQLHTAKLLLEYGANINIVDGVDSKTALHYAAELGFRDLVDMLLSAGCHPDPLDCHGMTPELLAIENGHLEVAALLTRHLDQLEEKARHLPGVEVATKGSTAPNGREELPSAKPWRLPLQRGPNIGHVMREGICIYAVDETTCPPELGKLLGEREGQGVTKLGQPFRRRIVDSSSNKGLDGGGGDIH